MILLQDLLKEADSYKMRIASAMPLSMEHQKLLDQFFRVGFTYSSSALEGNPLTLSQTRMLLEDSKEASGLPPKACREVIGCGDAYDFMEETAKQKAMDITEDTFKKLHCVFYQKLGPNQAGRYRTEPACMSQDEGKAPDPDEISHLMSHLADQIHSSQFTLHPVELAAMAHKRLTDIQPFCDGNGMIARLLMNLILLHAGYCVVLIPPARRSDYLTSLSASRRQKDMEPFSRVIAECVIETNKNCCRLFDL